MTQDSVLVTGGTGFIAQHCIITLLTKGYEVRTTVRSADRKAEVLKNLKEGGCEPGDRLSFFVADLMADEGWADAMAGCSYVMHGASPTPSGNHATDDDWIKPAVDGNLRVLRAASFAGVKRVVLTSAFGAVGVGHPAGHRRPFDETDWSDVSGKVWPYQKSKTMAEKAAWDFVEKEGRGLELSAVNPVAVMGPVLGPDFSHSTRLVKNMLDGQKGNPNINSCFVDVRDVADLHWLAMTHPAANGERFLASSGSSLLMVEVAKILRKHLGEAASKVSTLALPDWMVRLAAHKNPGMKGSLTLLGMDMNVTNAKAVNLLGWAPRSPEEAIVATAESFIRLGLLEK